jgi:hypothetical protein
MDTQKQIVERLQEANNVLLTVSKNPNVDQLAACIGLSLILDNMDKHAAAVYSGHTPSVIEFLNPNENLETNTDSLQDFIISLDKSKADKLRYKVEDDVVRIFITPYRTSINEKDLEYSQGDFNVDVVVAIGVSDPNDLDDAITAHGRILHDATVVTINNTQSGELGTVNWVDEKASSVSEMATKLATQLGKDVLDEQNATALLTGIVAETNRFSNEKTSADTMKLTANLLTAGANQQLVATKLAEPAEIEQFDNDSDHGDPESDGGVKLPEADVSDDGTLKIDHQEEEAEEEEEKRQEEEREEERKEKERNEERETSIRKQDADDEAPKSIKENFDRDRVGDEHPQPPKETHPDDEFNGGGSITGGPHLDVPTKGELLTPFNEDDVAAAETPAPPQPPVNIAQETLITPTQPAAEPLPESIPDEVEPYQEQNNDSGSEEPQLPQLAKPAEFTEHPEIKKEKRPILDDPNKGEPDQGILGVVPEDEDQPAISQPNHDAALNNTILDHRSGNAEDKIEEHHEKKLEIPEHDVEYKKPLEDEFKQEFKEEPHDNESPQSYNPDEGYKGGLKVQQEPTIKLPKAVDEKKLETLAEIEQRLGAVHKPPKHVREEENFELDLSKLEQPDGSEGPAVLAQEEEGEASPPATPPAPTVDDARNAVAAAVENSAPTPPAPVPTPATAVPPIQPPAPVPAQPVAPPPPPPPPSTVPFVPNTNASAAPAVAPTAPQSITMPVAPTPSGPPPMPQPFTQSSPLGSAPPVPPPILPPAPS